MHSHYRTFVISPPALLEEEPQLTDHVVWKALENTFGRELAGQEVASARATRLDDGRLRVEAWLFGGPGVTVPQSPYGDAFRYNVQQAARAAERDGISYLFTGLAVPRGYLDNPDQRELLVAGAVERTFPELVGQEYRLDHDLHCEVDPRHTATGPDRYFLDVAVTANAHSGLTGRDDDVRYASFDRHLADLTSLVADRGEAEDGRSDTTPAQSWPVLLPITVPLRPEHALHFGHDLVGDERIVACALERTFPELRCAEYGFDYAMGEDSVQITLGAQPRQSLQPQATEAWEVSLAAPENERAAALESNLDDVILDEVDRPTSPEREKGFYSVDIRGILDEVDRVTRARAFSR